MQPLSEQTLLLRDSLNFLQHTFRGTQGKQRSAQGMWESSEGEPVTDLYINLDKQTSSHTDTLIHTLTHTRSNTFIPRPRLEL